MSLSTHKQPFINIHDDANVIYWTGGDGVEEGRIDLTLKCQLTADQRKEQRKFDTNDMIGS